MTEKLTSFESDWKMGLQKFYGDVPSLEEESKVHSEMYVLMKDINGWSEQDIALFFDNSGHFLLDLNAGLGQVYIRKSTSERFYCGPDASRLYVNSVDGLHQFVSEHKNVKFTVGKEPNTIITEHID